MQKSQLLDICRALEKKEIRELKKWLISPAHNHRTDVVQLFDYLITGDHLFNDKYLDKERIFRKLFPEESFEDAKLRQTMHFLLKAMEEYLAHNALLEDDISTQFALAKTYRHKKLEGPYQKVIKQVGRMQEKQVVQDDQFYMNQHDLYQEIYNTSALRKGNDAKLQELSDALEVSFIIRKLRMACFMVNHQSIFKQEYDYGMLDPLLAYVEANDLLSVKAIEIYYYCYKSIRYPEQEEFYFTFRDSIFTNNEILPHSEMHNNYLLAVNYCSTKVNQFKEGFKRELFDLYRKGIENKVLLNDDGILTNSTFRNTVNIGTVIKEFDWIKGFIEQYQKYLPAAIREQMVQSAWGKYYFEKGDYPTARDYLMQVNPSNVLLNLNIKSMLVRIYYHEDEFQLLDALLESMKVYINRKKILVAQHKRPFKNLIKYTKKLVKVNPYDRGAKTKLRQEIEEAHPLIAKDWFLEQVDRL